MSDQDNDSGQEAGPFREKLLMDLPQSEATSDRLVALRQSRARRWMSSPSPMHC